MADSNTTGDGDRVALSIPPKDRKFLRSVFSMARGGIRDELAEYPEQLREPTRLHREEAVYDKLLAALQDGELVVDHDVRQVLADLAQTIDRANEYQRVVAEHVALVGLHAQVGEPCRRRDSNSRHADYDGPHAGP